MFESELFWKRLRILVAICILVTIGRGQAVVETSAKKERIEAERLWEQIVKVRGGRGRLNSISTLLITKGTGPDSTQIQLYAFPGKYWEWSKEKALRNTMWVKMANLDNGVFYVGSFEGLLTVNENVGPKKKADYYAGYLMDGCAFLLETKWLRPTPVRVTQDTIGKQRFDVIETRLTHLNEYQDWRMDYYVDPESLVVKGVASYPAAGNRSHFIRFGGYTTVDGLSVPTKMATTFKVEEPKKSAYTPLTFRFNVDYDPKIFEHPPSVEAGPDAWKSKK